MNKIFINSRIFSIFTIFLFSFFFNYYYANLGVSPMDTFAFFDTAYNITIGRHPFKDIWVTTGPVVDYIQAIFFQIFGLNWLSYIIHGSLINSVVTIFFYKILLDQKLEKKFSFCYAIFFGLLCYTVSGTPFAYIHSYAFSIISILIFIKYIQSDSKIYLSILPPVMVLAFLSMQNPSTFINLIIISILITIFLKKRQKENVKIFILSSFATSIFLIIFFLINEIPLKNFFQQYFLFPLSMGEGRILGNELAHFSLSDRFTIRNIIGHFKFINFFILILTFFTIKDLMNKKISLEFLFINVLLILCGIFLIFNQLLTSNQTYIFSLIPFLAAFTHLYLIKRNNFNKKIILVLFAVVCFCAAKYHLTYNEARKFMDLQNVNLKNSVEASNIDYKLKGLKWISPNFSDNAEEEVKLLKEVVNHLKKEKKNKMLISHYQFFSVLTEENLNTLNRWYTHDNNSYPLSNHKYFELYKSHINNSFSSNKIEVVFTTGNLKLENFDIFLEETCYNKTKINKILFKYEIKKCT